MGAYTSRRFILVHEEDGVIQKVKFPPFFGNTPKEAWDICEQTYGKNAMTRLQDAGFVAVEVTLTFKV